MADDEVKIVLSAEDQATPAIENVKQRLSDLGATQNELAGATQEFNAGIQSQEASFASLSGQMEAFDLQAQLTNKDWQDYATYLSEANTKTEEGAGLIDEFTTRLEYMAVRMAATFVLFKGWQELTKTIKNIDEAEKTLIETTGAFGDKLDSLKGSLSNVLGTVPQNIKDVSITVADINQRFGVTGQQLDNLSKNFLDFSRITGSNVKQSIQDVSQMMNNWNISTDKTSRVLDALTTVSQKTGIGVDSLTKTAQQFGEQFRSMGFDFTHTIALLGNFQMEGGNTEKMVTALNLAMTNFAKHGIKDPAAAFSELIANIKDAKTDMDAAKISIAAFGAKAGPDFATQIREGKLAYGDLVKSIQDSKGIVEKTSDTATTLSDTVSKMGNNIVAGFTQASGAASILNEQLTKINDSWTENNRLNVELSNNLESDSKFYDQLSEAAKNTSGDLHDFFTKWKDAQEGIVASDVALREGNSALSKDLHDTAMDQLADLQKIKSSLNLTSTEVSNYSDAYLAKWKTINAEIIKSMAATGKDVGDIWAASMANMISSGYSWEKSMIISIDNVRRQMQSVSIAQWGLSAGFAGLKSAKKSTDEFGTGGGGGGGGADLSSLLDSGKKTKEKIDENMKGFADALEKSADAYRSLSTEGAKDLETLKEAHNTTTKDIIDKLVTLDDTYKSTIKSEKESLQSLAEQHNKTTESIQNNIDKIRQSLSDLDDKLAADTQVAVDDLSKAFIETKKSVADLQNQLDNWKTPNNIAETQLKIDQLQEKLNQAKNPQDQRLIEDEIKNQKIVLQSYIDSDSEKKKTVQDSLLKQQASLNQYSDLAAQYAKDIANAQKSADATVLESAVKTFQQKTLAAQDAYNKQKNVLNQQLSDLQASLQIEMQAYSQKEAKIEEETAVKLKNLKKQKTDLEEKLKEENTLYKEKSDEINKILKDAYQYRREQEDYFTQQVTSDIEAQIKEYQKLAQAISAANSAKSAGILHVTTKARATGGPVSPDEGYLVGENGPEYFNPSTSGTIIPNDKLGGNTTINFNFNGVISSKQVAQEYADIMFRNFKLQSQAF